VLAISTGIESIHASVSFDEIRIERGIFAQREAPAHRSPET
jgi:hypothetical protein